MTNEEKAIQIYNVTYDQAIEDGYPKKVAITCAIMGKMGAEIMAEWKDKQHSIVYVVTRSDMHYDEVEKVFFDIEKAKQYCAGYNNNENAYRRNITKINVTL